ncbi:bifunctional methylenetetrahydrofolate dehydrogenase/methenyltetrahydrofolate cyclohydrolase FolD [Metabacillus rhizolycopersici]|uniref:Bifunctional protein FolD n=1 Tax=Metabacillus rhizolycopersici TaxID=2875709 RepID=A0ABS7USS6_9BACI|nr:bifunctional methylenetetrahydrofolate dehydrogenase/methenyltetrahydrofolate cyclohydrolase FolD [Metabacillus rhizolycopersici]MBZ5751350.1 bifunctional methylenetetrahydrofolate dehydrogenase/methenyltetrahydrofolate cyclohydrolase FolD [Metabacillus rhizolycopersici]
MTAKIINGKEIATKKRIEIDEKVKQLKAKNVTPGLAVILVGNNHDSRTFVNIKLKACEELGMYSILIEMPEEIREEELLAKIEELNGDPKIHGILVQLPLPKHIDEKKVSETIIPAKDVDGLHPINIGRLMKGRNTFLPCAPYGIIVLLEESEISVSGKKAVVVGRSNIVGKPIGQLLLNQNATVTYCHSKTRDLKLHTTQADILIVDARIANFIKAEHIKEGAVVIDVGMNRNEAGKLCGDVAFDEVSEKAGYITPVPKGVGPMTITMLMYNTLKSAKESLR